MAHSGYVMVDATGLDVAINEAQTVTGFYEKLENALATGKMIMLCNMVNGEAAVSPTPCSCTMGAGATITLSGFSAVVTNDDEVTPVA